MNNAVYKKITNCFENVNWNFLWDEKNHVFTWGVKTENYTDTLNFVLQLEDDHYIVYAFSQNLNVNADYVNVTLKLINEINTQMIFGAFEYVESKSEVRFKLYVDCLNQAPSPDIIKRSIFLPAHMLIKHGDKISAVARGKLTLAEALKARKEN